MLGIDRLAEWARIANRGSTYVGAQNAEVSAERRGCVAVVIHYRMRQHLLPIWCSMHAPAHHCQLESVGVTWRFVLHDQVASAAGVFRTPSQ
jgi:hypothetical protein